MCLGFLYDLLRTRGLVHADAKHARGALEALKGLESGRRPIIFQ